MTIPTPREVAIERGLFEQTSKPECVHIVVMVPRSEADLELKGKLMLDEVNPELKVKLIRDHDLALRNRLDKLIREHEVVGWEVVGLVWGIIIIFKGRP